MNRFCRLVGRQPGCKSSMQFYRLLVFIYKTFSLVNCIVWDFPGYVLPISVRSWLQARVVFESSNLFFRVVVLQNVSRVMH